MKLHTLAFVVVKFRDAVSIYSRVEVRIEQVEKLKTSCQHTPGSLTSDAWASIQCRVERQSMLSWLSMWKKMQCQKDLKVVDSVQTQICPHGVPERKNPNSIAYCIEKRNISDSYIPRRV